MAKAVGVTPTSVSEWESDKSVPREDALAKLADYLGVTPAYLRYGIGDLGIAEQAEASAEQTITDLTPPTAKKATGGGRLHRGK
jgi:transcriptional regulator with XRE-family HTH domain